MKLYALPVQDSLGGWRSFCYHSGLATLSEGYDPFTDPYQNFLKVDNHGGAEHDICDLEVDSWIR